MTALDLFLVISAVICIPYAADSSPVKQSKYHGRHVRSVGGLTVDEIALVRGDWGHFVQPEDKKHNADDFLISLYQNHPVTQLYFKLLHDKTLEELKVLPAFSAQAQAIIDKLTEIVAALDNSAAFDTLTHWTAKFHHDIGINVHYFEYAFATLLDTMHLSGSNKDAMKKMFAVVYNEIEHEYEDLETMTEEELGHINAAWNFFMQNRQANANTLLLNFFKRDPDAKELFPKFHDKSLDELKTDPALALQAGKIVDKLSETIHSLNDHTALLENIHWIAEYHHGKHIDVHFFKDMFEVLEEELAGLTGEFNKPAWDKATAIMYNHLADEYVKLEELSPACIAAVKANWAVFFQDKHEHDLFLIRFFKEHADAQLFFPKLKGKTPEELATDPELSKQAELIVGRLNDIITHLDDEVVLDHHIEWLVEFHHDMGVTLQNFKDMLNVLEEELLSFEGLSLAKESWDKAVELIENHIETEIKKHAWLTTSEVISIQNNWEVIEQGLERHATDFLARLFKMYPATLDYFAKFKGKSLSKLVSSTIFTSQAVRIFNGLTGIVDHLDDSNALHSHLHYLAEFHHGMDVKVIYFEYAFGVLEDYLHEVLGDTMNKNTWNKMFVMVYREMEEAFKDRVTNALSPLDIANIKKNWEVIMETEDIHAFNFLTAVFDTYPAAQDYFSEFKGINEDELESVGTKDLLVAQAVRIFNGVNDIIEDLADESALETYLHWLVTFHNGQHVKPIYFRFAFSVLGHYLQMVEGPDYNKESWEKMFDMVYHEIAHEYEELDHLTAEDITGAQENWAEFYADKENNGNAFLLKLFETHPEIQNSFPEFKNKTAEELSGSSLPAVTSQAGKILDKFGDIISNLEEEHTHARDNAIHWVAEFHHGLGIKAPLIMDAFEVLKSVMEKKEAGHFHADAWDHVIGFVYRHIDDEYQKLSSLTHAELHEVQEEWAVFVDQAHKQDNAKAFLLYMFQEHPEIQAKFPKFAGESAADLAEDPALVDQAIKIVNHMDKVITSLDHPDDLNANIHWMSKFHHDMGTGIDPHYFEDAFSALQHQLGEVVSHFNNDLWTKTFELIEHHLVDDYQTLEGLDASEIENIQHGWHKVMEHAGIHGPEFLLRLFDTYPATRHFFTQFEGRTDIQLRSGSSLRAHAIKIMGGFNKVIAFLDDHDALVDHIKWLANFHFRMGLKMPYFKKAFDTQIDYLHDVFGDSFHTISWKKAFAKAYDLLEHEFQALRGVSASDITAVQANWDIIMHNKEDHGARFLLRLFDTFPRTQDFFSKLKDKSEEELRAGTALADQAGKIFDGINTIVHNLDNYHELDHFMHWMGSFHQNMHVGIQYFEYMLAVLGDYLHDVFGDDLNSEAWEKTFDLIYRRMNKEYKHLAGLTPSEVSSLQSNWAVIDHYLKAHGHEILIRFFRAYPGALKHFPKLSGHVDDFRVQPALDYYATLTMSGFTTLFHALDNKESFNRDLEHIAEDHHNRHIELEYIKFLLSVVQDYVHDVVGKDFHIEEWKKVVKLIYKGFKHEYEKLSGLTEVEKGEVQRTWATVMHDKTFYGNQWLIRLFRRYPAIQDKFDQFKGKSVSDLEGSAILSDHAERIMGGINTIVVNLDDHDALSNHIQWMASFHNGMGIKAHFFPYAFTVLVNYLEDAFGDDFHRHAWEKTFAIVYRELKEDFEHLSVLSTSEIEAVQENWDVFMEDLSVNSERFLIDLFHENPETQTYFKNFKGRSKADLQADPAFDAHAVKIINRLNDVVHSLDDKEAYHDHLEWIAEFHSEQGIKVTFFRDAFDVLEHITEEQVEKSGGHFHKEAWEKTFAIVYQGIEEAFKEVGSVSPTQIAEVRENWEVIKRNKNFHGSHWLRRLFQVYPALQDSFPKLKALTSEELKSNAEVEIQAVKIMDGLEGIISSLDDVDEFEQHLHYLADFHHDMGIEADKFRFAFIVLKRYAQDVLGSSFHTAAWKKTFHYVFKHMKHEFQLLEGLNPPEISAIQENWHVLMDHPVLHGNELAVRFFLIYPGTLVHFPKFSGHSEEELREGTALTFYSQLFFHGVNTIILSLKDQDICKEHIDWLAKDHFNRGIELTYVKFILAVTEDYVHDVVGDAFDKTAWDKATAMIYREWKHEYEELQGLSPEQLTAVKESWETIIHNKELHGKEFLGRLFTAYPGTQKYFSKFKGKPLSELKAGTALTEQAGRIFNGLNDIIVAISDKDALHAKVVALAQFHEGMHIRPEQFVFAFDVLEQYFGDVFASKTVSAAWHKTFSILKDTFTSAFEELSGLNPAEIPGIRENWAVIMKHKVLHGDQFLIRLFRNVPATQGYFEKFSGKSSVELLAGNALSAHSVKIMDGLDKIVATLENKHALHDHIEFLAKFHHNMYIDGELFEYAFDILVEYLHDVLGSDLHTESWHKMYAMVYRLLQADFKKLAPLTATQISSLRNNWHVIFTMKEIHGTAFLIKLFGAYPATKEYFPKMRGHSLIELKGGEEISSQGVKIFKGLNKIIENLDNRNGFASQVDWLADFHADMDIPVVYFEYAFSILTDYFHDVLGSNFDKAAWVKMFDTVFHRFYEDYEKRTGLSSGEVESVLADWEIFMSDKQKHADEWLLKLFHMHPVTQTYFPAFRGKTEEELSDDPALSAQSGKIIDKLNTILLNLKAHDVIDKETAWLAEFHHDRGVKAVFFKYAFKTMIDYLIELEGAGVHEDLWEKTFDMIYHNIEEEYKALEKLSPAEISEVQSNWHLFMEKKTINGRAFLLKLFHDHPETKGFFDAFRGKTDDELTSDPAVTAQSDKILDKLTEIIDHLDDSVALERAIEWTAKFHHDRHINVEFFQDAFAIIGDLAHDMEGSTLHESVWHKTFAMIYAHLHDEYQRIEGLTHAEIVAIHENWDIYMRDESENAKQFLLRLFKRYRATQDYFTKFSGKDLEDLESDPQLVAHAVRIIEKLDGVLHSMEDSEVLAGNIHWLVDFHTNLGVDITYLKHAFEIIENQIYELEGDDMAHEAWDKAFAWLYSLIRKEFKKLTGATAAEIAAVRENWDVFEQNEPENANAWLISLFREHPATQWYFSMFRGKSLDELSEDPAVTGHAQKIVHKIGEAIETIEDDDAHSAVIEWIANFHHDRKIKVNYFKYAFDTLKDIVEHLDGVVYHGEAWDKILNSIYHEIEDQYLKLDGPTHSEAAALHANWDVFMKDRKDNAVHFLIKLFTDHPDTQPFFDHFKDRSMDDLRADPAFALHAEKIIDKLDGVLDHLDDSSLFDANIHWLSTFHNARGIDVHFFKHAFEVIVNCLDELIPTGFNRGAFEHAFAMIYRYLAEDYHDVEELAQTDIDAVHANWDTYFAADSKATRSVAFFSRLFETHPDVQPFFSEFAGKPVDEVKVSSGFADQALKILEKMNLVIDSLGNKDNMDNHVHWLAMYHHDLGIGVEFFQDAFDVLEEEVHGVCGEGFNEQSWNAVIHNVYNSLKLEYLYF